MTDDRAKQGTMSDDKVKQGHSCCGCCCDMRRAVIIVNIINLVSLLIQVILFLSVDVDGVNTTLFIVASIIGFVVLFVGIIGANQFNKWLVGIAGFFYAANVIYLLVLSFAAPSLLFSAALSVLYVYPHVMFVVENGKGIMTQENYKNEEQSCCCV
jgi:hypothetical protein